MYRNDDNSIDIKGIKDSAAPTPLTFTLRMSRRDDDGNVMLVLEFVDQNEFLDSIKVAGSRATYFEIMCTF